MDYHIVEANTLPIPRRIIENPIMKLEPGQAVTVEVESLDEQLKCQNKLSAKARTAARHTNYKYQTMKYETLTPVGEKRLFVAVKCSP
jgi:hypothetical protein